MMTDPYRPPTDPPDPQAAALDHLVRAPEAAGTNRFRAPLQDLAAILDAEGAFTVLGWPDARGVAAAISFDAITEDDPSEVLRDRARVLLADGGTDWDNPLGVARALTIAATVLDMM
jgi:hypothetical protein